MMLLYRYEYLWAADPVAAAQQVLDDTTQQRSEADAAAAVLAFETQLEKFTNLEAHFQADRRAQVCSHTQLAS